jgi:hypothetical protein
VGVRHPVPHLPCPQDAFSRLDLLMAPLFWQVFDVHSGVSKVLLPGGAGGPADNEVQVPWGVGVLGHVAETGEAVNLQIACEVRECIYCDMLTHCQATAR